MRNRLLILTVVLLTLAWTVSAAQETNQAGLVVRYDDARVESYCVSFAESEITGRALMDHAGLSLEADEVGMGASICRIEDVGCPSTDCFCDCQGGACTYWSYWLLRDGDWQYSAAGASISQVSHGDVQGWSWGPGSVSEAIAPPPMTFEEVCGETASDVTDAGTGQVPGTEVAARPVATTAPPQSLSGDAESSRSIPGSYLFLGIVLILLATLTARAHMQRKS